MKKSEKESFTKFVGSLKDSGWLDIRNWRTNASYHDKRKQRLEHVPAFSSQNNNKKTKKTLSSENSMKNVFFFIFGFGLMA